MSALPPLPPPSGAHLAPDNPVVSERRRQLALSATGFCTFLGMYATQALLPVLAEQFHATKVQAGLTVSATTLAVALLAPVVGFVTESLSPDRKRVIVGGLLALAVPTLLGATAGGLSGLVAWRFAQGVCIAVVYVTTMTYVNEEWAGGGAGAAMAAYVSGNVLGGFTGRFLSGLMTGLLHWRWTFIALAGLNLAGGLFTWWALPAGTRVPIRQADPSGRPGLADLVTAPLLATYGIGFSLLFALIGLFTYVTFYLAQAPFRLGATALGCIFAVYLVGMVVTPIAGRWIDRVGNRRVGMAAVAVSGLGSLVMLLPSLPAIVAGLALCSSGVFVGQAAASSFMGRAAGAQKGRAAGLYIACYYAGGSAGAVLLGLVWPFGGWPACVGVVVALQLGTMVTMHRFWRAGLPGIGANL